MNVGDIYISLRADGGQFKTDVQKAASDAGDAAGKTFGDRFGSALRAGATTIGLAAGAVFAGVTKLAVESQDAMARFQAQTGATADEAKTAFDSMNRLAGQNLQTFDQVSQAFTSVTTNLGLTGQAAEDATNQILKFSTATGTDAVQNVKAFDDILDAWKLTAADLPGIMDQIVASTQKWGGSVGEAQQALKDMAPALQGMGASLADGIGLLDLFRASGFDASAATRGLNTALSKLKPGQSLNDLIAQIGAIEDPTKRAQEAARIFGNRVGPGLANAIKPGMKSLDEFKVSMGDAAGATTDAANAIESTLPNQIKLGISHALEAVRGFGQDFGPALTGAASLISLGTSFASALRLDKAVGGALKSAWDIVAGSDVVKKAAASAGEAYAAAYVGGAAGGGLLGKAAALLTVAAPIAIPVTVAIVGFKLFTDVLNDPRTQAAWKQNATAMSDWIKQMNAAAAIAYVTSHALAITSAQDAVNLAIATQAWGRLGPEALQSGHTVNEAIDQLKSQGWTAEDIQKLSDSALEAWTAVGERLEHNTSFITKAAAVAGTAAGDSFGTGLVHEAQAKLLAAGLPTTWDALYRGILDHPTGSFTKKGADDAGAYGQGFTGGLGSGENLFGPLTHTLHGPTHGTFYDAGNQAWKEWADGFGSGAKGWQSAFGPSAFSAPDFIQAWKNAGYGDAKGLGDGFGLGLRQAKQELNSEWKAFLDDLAHPGRGFQNLMSNLGRLAGDKLREGLNSSDPETRRAAFEMQQHIVDRLRKLQGEGYDIGKAVPKLLAQGIDETALRAALAALGMTQDAIDAMFKNTKKSRGAGHEHGDQFVGGITDKKPAAHRAGVELQEKADEGLAPDTGTGPGTPWSYGAHLAERYISGVISKVEAAEIAGNTLAHGITSHLRLSEPGPDTAEGIRRLPEYAEHFVDRYLGPIERYGPLRAASAARGLANALGDALRLGGPGLGLTAFSPTVSLAPFEHQGSLVVRHEFGTIHVDGTNLSPAAAGELGRGIGDRLSEVVTELRRGSTLPLGSPI